MSSIGDEIKVIILKNLPNLSEDTQKQIITALEISGVESTEDFKYVQQISCLLSSKGNFWRHSKWVSIINIVFSCPVKGAVLEPSTPCTSRSLRQSANTPSKWHETFEVPWDKMPEEVQSAIANSKRPAPDKRRQMIRILVDEMRRYEVNPTRSEYLVICQNIVKQYPSSFADMTTGGVIVAGGFTSLLSQVKTRIENINRAGTLKRHRTSRRSGHLQRPTDSYGCTQFQPDPPPEEPNETVEQKRQQLVNIYRQEGIQGSERAVVINLMKTTFCLQHLRIQWPYLFTPRGLYCHFELTDITVLHALELSIEECGQGIEKYLRTKLKNKDVQSEDGELTLCIIQLLMAYFDERTEGLILLADMSATAADVEHTLTLPTSPRLILLVAGDGVTLGHWMISIEGIQKTFITGLAAVFTTYYVFNLQYQEEAATTQEFVQRHLVGINPERGRKTSQGKVVSKKTGKLVHKKATTVNPHVATLLKNLMDFEWGFI
uniref:Uncharacterized protein n=1 Tax=Esox lucius TaxID=8010 RepID=A0A3P9A0A1_ESOLU